MGNFCILAFLSDISQQRVDGSTPNFMYVGTMSADVPPPPLGFVGPWGAGGVKTQCIGQLPFLFFSALLNVVQYVGQGTDLRTFWRIADRRVVE